MHGTKIPDARPGAARNACRFYAAPCDDDNGRTWDVLDRGRFTDSDAFIVEQCLPTRVAAMVAAARWNEEAEATGPSITCAIDVAIETADRLATIEVAREDT